MSARNDGAPVAAAVEVSATDRGMTTIRVGDPDRTVTGVHTYVIDYTAKGVVTAGDGGPRLAWNALGTGWRTPVDTATVRIAAPGGLTGPVCYAGRAGSHDGCGTPRTAHGRVTYTARHLAVGEGVAVSAGLSAAHVQAHPLLVRDGGDGHTRDNVILVAFGSVMALVLVVTVLVVRRIPRPPHRPGRPGGFERLFGGGGFYGGGGGGGGFSGGGGGGGGGGGAGGFSGGGGGGSW